VALLAIAIAIGVRFFGFGRDGGVRENRCAFRGSAQ
jgi:hypothetical protein